MTQCVAETACRQRGARGFGNRLTVREMAARGLWPRAFRFCVAVCLGTDGLLWQGVWFIFLNDNLN